MSASAHGFNERKLEQLLSEPLESVRRRQRETLGQVMGGESAPFVLFGAGNLGRRVLPLLREAGLEPLAIMDNDASLWGQSLEGIEIVGPAQVAHRMAGRLPAVIAAIGAVRVTSQQMASWLAPLRSLGFQRVALFGHLAWRFPDQLLPYQCLDLPEKVVQNADGIRKAFHLLADESSRALFVAHLDWRLTLNYEVLPQGGDDLIYFSDQLSSRNDAEVLYDIGAFTGDSIVSYLQCGRRHREVHSFEPSAGNYAQLQANFARLAEMGCLGLHAHLLAVGDVEGSIAIASSGGHTLKVGEGDEQVPLTTLDALTSALLPPTFVKMDIEGFEPQCLAGGRQLIAEHHPVLAVCAYHDQDHLWSLLLQIEKHSTGYQFRLCQHVYDRAWDIVIYAVPMHRLPQEPDDAR